MIVSHSFVVDLASHSWTEIQHFLRMAAGQQNVLVGMGFLLATVMFLLLLGFLRTLPFCAINQEIWLCFGFPIALWRQPHFHKRLLQEARMAQVNKIVLLSSGGMVCSIPKEIPVRETHPTEPISAYGVGKLAIEKYLHLYKVWYGIEYCILRIAYAYGERQPITETHGVISAFLGRVTNDEPIHLWGNGTIARAYIHVEEIVNALIKAASYKELSSIFNIGSGKGYSLNEVVGIVRKATQKPAQVKYSSGRPFDVPINVLDISC